MLAALLVVSGLAGAAWPQDTPVYFAPDPGVARVWSQAPEGFALRNARLAI